MSRLRVVAVLASLALVVTACDWSMFRGGPHHTGENLLETVIGINNVGSMAEQWVAARPLPVARMPAAVVDDRVVIGGDGDVMAFAIDDNGCVGDPADCPPVWRHDLPGHDDAGAVAVHRDHVYVPYQATLHVISLAGTGCSGAGCEADWTAPLAGGSAVPTIADDRVYVTTGGAPSRLEVFDALGVENCAGTPAVCEPLWTANLGFEPLNPHTATVARDRVYAPTGQGRVRVFDAAGLDGCSGDPVLCQPLWVIDTGDTGRLSTIAASDGRGYVSSPTATYVFDLEPCGTSPCGVLGSGPGGDAAPAVAGGLVLTGGTELQAFSSELTTGCSGQPAVCTALWSSNLGTDSVGEAAVANDVAYVSSERLVECMNEPVFFCEYEKGIHAFDATGATCAGTPVICAPLWQDFVPDLSIDNASTEGYGSPVVANGVVYVARAYWSASSDEVVAFAPTQEL
ncbi:MAG: PQQ-binding-like beta-propeller repeat protein [Acidimicrobiales bacterium]